jgi:hypothetical protein
MPSVVFRNVRLVRRGSPELGVELHFGGSELSIKNIGGRTTFHSLPYSAIADAEYHESRHSRVFVRTTRHWLVLKGAGGQGVLLRLERDNFRKVLDAVEQRLGRAVTIAAPQQEQEEEREPGAA